LATVTFTVKTAAGAAITGLGAAVASVSSSRASFQIASLAPKGGGLSYNKWVPYIYYTQGTPCLTYVLSRTASLVHEGPAGTYTYTFAQNLSTATYPDTGAVVGYDRTRTHRVIVALRSGYSGGNTFDFVPAAERLPRRAFVPGCYLRKGATIAPQGTTAHGEGLCGLPQPGQYPGE